MRRVPWHTWAVRRALSLGRRWTSRITFDHVLEFLQAGKAFAGAEAVDELDEQAGEPGEAGDGEFGDLMVGVVS